MAIIKRPKVKHRADRLKADKIGITHEMVKAVELLIHRFGDKETIRMLQKLCHTQSDHRIARLLCEGKYPLPPELTTKYKEFVYMFVNKCGFSSYNLYDIRIKSEAMFIVRAIVCYHFAITLNMQDSQVMAMMKYRYKEDIQLNVGRIETELRNNHPEFMYFWNIYQEYLDSLQPKEKKKPGRPRGQDSLLNGPIKPARQKKKYEWGD